MGASLQTLVRRTGVGFSLPLQPFSCCEGLVFKLPSPTLFLYCWSWAHPEQVKRPLGFRDTLALFTQGLGKLWRPSLPFDLAVEGQMVTIVCTTQPLVTTIQLCHCSIKAADDNTDRNVATLQHSPQYKNRLALVFRLEFASI